MKLFIFLFGLLCGAAGLHFYYTAYPEKSPGHVPAGRTYSTVPGSIAPHSLREEIARTGRVVRSKASAAGQAVSEAYSNTKVISVLKAKLALDKEVSARDINVYCDHGVVTLTGIVATPEALSKAVALALETEGVTQVISYLVIPSEA